MPETVLTRQDQGRTILTNVGNVLCLHLDESPTTGYAWVNRSTGAALSLAGSDYAIGSAGAVGGGGVRSFRLSAVAPGTATLRFALLRGWEADAAPADEFSAQVEVRSP